MNSQTIKIQRQSISLAVYWDGDNFAVKYFEFATPLKGQIYLKKQVS